MSGPNPDANKTPTSISTRRIHIVPANEPVTTTQEPGVRVGANVTALQMLKDVFMPAGYPNSVSPDYLNYQIFDSLQAFSSTIAGLFAARAVLEGFGVNDAKLFATTALFINIVQDAGSRLSTILFAWRIGTALEPESKKYRLLADIFNDTAMILDCLSPYLPSKSIRLLMVCLASGFRALCGVAAGGAKAALSVHFARANNVGDLNAKDSSQETVIGLLGMFAGSAVIGIVTNPTTTWIFLLTLIIIHLLMNYLAVRSVIMHTLNRQRLTLAYSTFRSTAPHYDVQTPAQIAKREYIFARGGRLYDYSATTTGAFLGYCKFESFVSATELGLPFGVNDLSLFDIFSDEKYMLSFGGASGGRSLRIRIYLREDATSRDTLKSWIHAIELAHLARKRRKNKSVVSSFFDGDELDMLDRTHRTISKTYSRFCEELKKKGWDLETDSLLTSEIARFRMTYSGDDAHKQETKKDI